MVAPDSAAASGSAIVERMMFGFAQSQILFVCHRLAVFDHLGRSGPSRCDEMAAALDLPCDSLERLLIGAACCGLLEKEDERYRVPELLAPYLLSASERYVGGRFSHYSNVSYQLFGHLEQAVRENRTQWHQILEHTAVNCIYADCVYADASATGQFLDTMWASGYADSLDLCEKMSFGRYERLVDLGGATGSFAIAALHKNPRLSAVVMDLAPVEPYALRAFAEHHCAERASFVCGDMFSDPLPKGDVYVIGYVLSDWSDAQCLALLRAAYAALPRHGAIVILEKFFNAQKTGPFVTGMLNLTMLLEMQGKHRSAPEYQRWLEDIGFTDVMAVYSSGEKHMLVGTKALDKQTVE